MALPYSAEDCATHNPDQQNHKYNGKEFDTTHGLNTYDYGARQYCSLFGRWDRMDPLCEKYYSVSPYAYCANNPVKYVDPDGKDYDVYYEGASRTLGNALLKAGAHGLSGGVQNALNGENFGIGFATGAIASFAGYGAQSAHFNACGVVGATTLAGGLTSWALGGDFFDGAMIGLSIGMMNDNLHPIDGGELPEAVCNGRKPFWMRAKEALEPAAGVAGNMAYAVGAYDHVSKNARIDSNGKFRFRKANGRIFYGNQNVKTNAIPKIPHAQGLGIGLSFVSELPDVAGAYYRYGFGSREFWRATTVATGRVAGGLVGSYAGTAAGSYVGGVLGSAVPIIGNGAGAVAGGMAGGMIGSYAGSEIGGAVSGYLFDVVF